MPNVEWVMTADEAAAVKAYMKVVDAQRKMERGADRAVKKTKKHDSAMKRFGASAGKELSGIAGRWIGVTAAITAVSKALQIVIADLRRVDELSKAGTMSVTAQIAAAGDMRQGARIRKFLSGKAMSQTGLTYQQAGGLYGAVRGAAPSIGLDRVLALTGKIAGATRAGVTPEQLPGLATIAGGLAVAAPGKTTGDIADLSMMIYQGQGRYGRKITRGGLKALQAFKSQGIGSLEQGIGMMMASVQAGQGAEAFQSLVDRLSEQRTMPAGRAGRRLTPAQKAERAFWSAGPQARMQMLRQDKGLRAKVMGTQTARLAAMYELSPRAQMAAALEAQRENEFAKAQDQALRDQAFAEELATQEQSAIETRRIQSEGLGAGTRYQRFYQARMRAKGAPAGLRAYTEYAGGMMEAIAPGITRDEADIGNAIRELRKAIDRNTAIQERSPGPAVHSEQ